MKPSLIKQTRYKITLHSRLLIKLYSFDFDRRHQISWNLNIKLDFLRQTSSSNSLQLKNARSSRSRYWKRARNCIPPKTNGKSSIVPWTSYDWLTNSFYNLLVLTSLFNCLTERITSKKLSVLMFLQSSPNKINIKNMRSYYILPNFKIWMTMLA